jgi:hypothetical protein
MVTKQKRGQCFLVVKNQYVMCLVEVRRFAGCSEIATAQGEEKSLSGSKPCTAVIRRGCNDIVPL